MRNIFAVFVDLLFVAAIVAILGTTLNHIQSTQGIANPMTVLIYTLRGGK
jgi:hypothetical protein